jgi:putative glutamine amidotransferase
MGERVYIGITTTETAYENYPLWAKGDDAAIEIIRLTPENEADFAHCAGLILSGGVDVFPGTYKSSRLDYPLGPKQHNPTRDAFEIGLFHSAMQKQLPVLAICRGMQLVNAALGGTLVQDLEEGGKQNHRKMEGIDGIHAVHLEPDSLLHSLRHADATIVNSAHHQAIDRLGEGLKLTAWSTDDHVPEAIEWADPAEKPFFLGVQWHPERIEQDHLGHVFTQNIRRAFLKAVRTFAA